MKIEMNPNEMVIKAADSNKVINGNSVKGKLILTNQRLCFWTDENGKGGSDFEILPEEIRDVIFFRNSLLFPKGLNIITKDGEENKFLVKNREDWSEMIVRMC